MKSHYVLVVILTALVFKIVSGRLMPPTKQEHKVPQKIKVPSNIGAPRILPNVRKIPPSQHGRTPPKIVLPPRMGPPKMARIETMTKSKPTFMPRRKIEGSSTIVRGRLMPPTKQERRVPPKIKVPSNIGVPRIRPHIRKTPPRLHGRIPPKMAPPPRMGPPKMARIETMTKLQPTFMPIRKIEGSSIATLMSDSSAGQNKLGLSAIKDETLGVCFIAPYDPQWLMFKNKIKHHLTQTEVMSVVKSPYPLSTKLLGPLMSDFCMGVKIYWLLPKTPRRMIQSFAKDPIAPPSYLVKSPLMYMETPIYRKLKVEFSTPTFLTAKSFHSKSSTNHKGFPNRDPQYIVYIIGNRVVVISRKDVADHKPSYL